MAAASNVSLEVYGASLPCISGVESLLELGCVAGATFRNKEFTEAKVEYQEGYNPLMKLLALDAQTSGGLLIGVNKEDAPALLKELKESGYHNQAAIIGSVCVRAEKDVYFY